MKMNEIKLLESEFLTDEDEIIKWVIDNFKNNITQMPIRPDCLTVKDGIVSCSVSLSVTAVNLKELKVQFGTGYSTFRMIDCGLTSLKGFPRVMHGVESWVNCSTNKELTSLEGITRSAYEIVFTGTGIKSLKNIHKQIDECDRIFISDVERDMLGVILIPGLNHLKYKDKNVNTTKAVNIISKYLGKGKAGVLEAQTELEESDLEEFASL